MKYRIYKSHCGYAPTNETFNCESDEIALTELVRRRNNPSNIWNVVEKTTRIDVK